MYNQIESTSEDESFGNLTLRIRKSKPYDNSDIEKITCHIVLGWWFSDGDNTPLLSSECRTAQEVEADANLLIEYLEQMKELARREFEEVARNNRRAFKIEAEGS
ncbi:hypothetical protein MYX64_04385 [Nitrospinae bacterium AH_259_B05_G02_I21]|nr:hypothetical protein [Nitrospinae bacterium AH_259_B05_G02_I21]